ncbi:Smr protein/MutS2 [Flexistipes sinusarabici DSM 4947]|uniref:Endonuclease MutS2 n=1 Tax=Flexistipes sinusarabici (strain ATCC 49648 / DSM 4947 / MAS 10) TaxID=717231 RepID=F8E638_FLESM|nr:Smr/MutS family protein [Flexistipes sinusarabici]AEI14746.1 Smr protein/MutS2 [Flexistipes sinusarabici DSM 4947]
MKYSDSLEFEKFKEIADSEFTSLFAKEKLSSLHPVNNLRKIDEKQKLLGETLTIREILKIALPDDSGYHEFYYRLKDPYASFMVEDIGKFRDFHKDVSELKKTLIESDNVVSLRDILKNMFSLSGLIETIDKKVTYDCKVKDSATPELKKIRSSLKTTRQRLIDSLNKLMFGRNSDKFVQEQVIKEIKGRFVIPVKSNFRQYFSGVVYSSSNTGQTLYVEPTAVIDLNNDFENLKSRESDEVYKILRMLLDAIKSHIYEVTTTVNAYTDFAYYFEMAKFYKNKMYTFPEFGEDVIFDSVHHPLIYLLKGAESVPIDFVLRRDNDLAVITGPNTGGKTAALKSAGLNCIIAKCGLPVFGNTLKMADFHSVFADIGDKQSLILDLSTFSSHMLNIKNILEEADKNSLVLLDELGTGTEPKEGAALAVSIIEYLLEKDAKVVVTTHFSEVKNYALKYKEAIIYSVDFDYENFLPKYRLLSGVVGKSNPLVIAGKLGFNETVIKNAENIIARNSSQAEFKLDELNEQKAALERRLFELRQHEQNVLEQKEDVERREKEINRKLRMKESEILEESYSLLQKLKRKVKSKKPVYPEKQLDEDINATEEKLNNVKKHDKPVENISKGDTVFLEKYNKEAEILDVDKDRVYVDMGGIKVKMSKNDIIGRKINKNAKESVKSAKKVKVSTPPNTAVKREIVVVGKTVDEAWDRVDKFIDEAILANISEIFIIHGRGSGALKRGIRDFLKDDVRVNSYKEASPKEGGSAVTVVNL